MAKVYRSREGEAVAVDTRTQLTTVGSETAPGALIVPAGAKKISRVIMAACQNMAAATGASAFLRIEGPGLPTGPETFAIASLGNDVATGGNATTRPIVLDIDIPVTPGNEILVYGEMAGTDVGQVSMAATLVFDM